ARRIGVLMPIPAEDQNVRDRLAAFRQALQAHGWMEGLNVEIDTRATGDRELLHQYAAELVALAPDVILAGNSLATRVLQAGYPHGTHRIRLNSQPRALC